MKRRVKPHLDIVFADCLNLQRLEKEVARTLKLNWLKRGFQEEMQADVALLCYSHFSFHKINQLNTFTP